MKNLSNKPFVKSTQRKFYALKHSLSKLKRIFSYSKLNSSSRCKINFISSKLFVQRNESSCQSFSCRWLIVTIPERPISNQITHQRAEQLFEATRTVKERNLIIPDKKTLQMSRGGSEVNHKNSLLRLDYFLVILS